MLMSKSIASDETNFGNIGEEIAVIVSRNCFGGMKSAATGLDLEFETEGTRYLVAKDDQQKYVSAFLVSNCTEGLDILSISGLFAVVNRDDLPPELLVELDSMEEFEFPPIWKSIFDIE